MLSINSTKITLWMIQVFFLMSTFRKLCCEFSPIRFLVKKFTEAGIFLLIKDITPKDIGIPTFVASSIESITSDYGIYAKGYGTHLDARIALVRAITELSQTRAVNIQGLRDDLKKIQYQENDTRFTKENGISCRHHPHRTAKLTKRASCSLNN